MKSPQPLQSIAERFPALEEQEVTLSFFAADAHSVEVAGDFSNWRGIPLEHDSNGDWSTRLRLKSGQYEYRFIVDGLWTDDELTPLRKPNPYGGFNSVINVGLDDRTDLL